MHFRYDRYYKFNTFKWNVWREIPSKKSFNWKKFSHLVVNFSVYDNFSVSRLYSKKFYNLGAFFSSSRTCIRNYVLLFILLFVWILRFIICFVFIVRITTGNTTRCTNTFDVAFVGKNSNPFTVFTKKLHNRCMLGL